MTSFSSNVSREDRAVSEFIFSAEFGPEGKRVLAHAPDLPARSGAEGWSKAYGGFVSYESAIDAADYATEKQMLAPGAVRKVIMATVDAEGNIHMVKDASGKESVIPMHEVYEAHGMVPPSMEFLAALELQDKINAVFLACVTEGKDRGWAKEELSALIHETQAEIVSKGWFTGPPGSFQSPVQEAAETHFTRDMSEFWIVNENGDNVRIKNQMGDDGCVYKRTSHNSVVQLVEDGDETIISGEFDYHAEPMVMDEAAPGF